MADVTSGDRPANSVNGATEGDQESNASASYPYEADQTLADVDQTLGDADQTGADREQTAAEGDQAAADRDQAASDLDLEQGGDPEVHDVTRDARDRGTQQRRVTATARVEAAAARDAVAHARDMAAAARDQAAALHDLELTAREAAFVDDGRAGPAIVRRVAENRRRAAAARATAAELRARAAADREQAARDRDQAARDRVQAEADRAALLYQLAIAETDALTGSRTRAAGLADLDRDIDRVRRTGGLLSIAYADVVGLKAVNDTQGHAAGDALLERVVHTIRAHLRSYDLIVRLGGDEFLCVMAGATLESAHERFALVEAALAAHPDRSEIRVGFATLAPEDSAEDLITRADSELPTVRRR